MAGSLTGNARHFLRMPDFEQHHWHPQSQDLPTGKFACEESGNALGNHFDPRAKWFRSAQAQSEHVRNPTTEAGISTGWRYDGLEHVNLNHVYPEMAFNTEGRVHAHPLEV